METKSLKNNPLQTKTLTPYLLVALTAAIIAVGSFLGGVAYQKSASDTQSGSPMNRNGVFQAMVFDQIPRVVTKVIHYKMANLAPINHPAQTVAACSYLSSTRISKLLPLQFHILPARDLFPSSL